MHHSGNLCKLAQTVHRSSNLCKLVQVRKNRERRLAREEEEMAGRLAEERRQEDGLAVAIRLVSYW